MLVQEPEAQLGYKRKKTFYVILISLKSFHLLVRRVCVPPQLGPYRLYSISSYLHSVLNARRTVNTMPVQCWGLMHESEARWTLWWEDECGLFCRLHLGLHMVQQTAVRGAGGRAGRAHLHLHSATEHPSTWQTERLPDHLARQMCPLSPVAATGILC